MPHFEINQRDFPTQKCAAYAETVCDMLRIGVRLGPFNCVACAVLCRFWMPPVLKVKQYNSR
jgi:hypothetical protein